MIASHIRVRVKRIMFYNLTAEQGWPLLQCCFRNADVMRCVHACAADWMHMTHVQLHGRQRAC